MRTRSQFQDYFFNTEITEKMNGACFPVETPFMGRMTLTPAFMPGLAYCYRSTTTCRLFFKKSVNNS